MATLELDPQTFEHLNALAAASGVTPAEYLKLFLPVSTNGAAARLALDEVESLLNQHAFDDPTLPADFSRADVYDEHD